jgi:hypothetical protein
MLLSFAFEANLSSKPNQAQKNSSENERLVIFFRPSIPPRAYSSLLSLDLLLFLRQFIINDPLS